MKKTLQRVKSLCTWAVGTAFMFLVTVDQALASTSTGMPWESGLQKINSSFTGPVAFAVTGVGTAGAGMALVLGREEMSDTMKTGVKVGFAGAFAALSTQIVAALYGNAAVF